MLFSWHNAFDAQITSTVFTDGDDAMFAAIASTPYSEYIKHLTCTFHLFDTNFKRKVQPVLTSIEGLSSWEGFRKALNVCREAGSESELELLWSDMLTEWLPKSPKTINVLS